MVRFLRGVAVYLAYWSGRWDECSRLADAFIAECRSGSPHYLEPDILRIRAQLLLARGELGAAEEEASAALTAGADVKDPGMVQPVISLNARLQAARGRPEDGRRFADELLAAPGPGVRPEVLVDLAWAARPLALDERLMSFFDRLVPQTAWHDAARAVVAERFEEAAERFDAIGSVPDAAVARLHAAEAAAAAGLTSDAERLSEEALIFFGPARATPAIERAERLRP